MSRVTIPFPSIVEFSKAPTLGEAGQSVRLVAINMSMKVILVSRPQSKQLIYQKSDFQLSAFLSSYPAGNYQSVHIYCTRLLAHAMYVIEKTINILMERKLDENKILNS